ncbi:cytochrome P450 [Streptomyces sp. NPDC093595]|uniref:cytochrome P450 n=1 Tax=Streptomyces sp. NPDC093595 TaxID=3366045 RepID=UPI0037FFD9C0
MVAFPDWINMRTRSGMPGPRGRFLPGGSIEFNNNPISWMTRARRDFGDVVRIDRDRIFLSDPEAVHEILIETNKSYLIESAFAAGRKGDAILTESVPSFMDIRGDVRRGATKSAIQSHLERLAKSIAAGVRERANQEVDVLREVQHILSCVNVDYCMGSDPESASISGLVEQHFWASIELVNSGETHWPWEKRLLVDRVRGINGELKEQLRSVVRRRKKEGTADHPVDFLDYLIADSNPLNESRTVSSLRLMLLGSHAIPATALTWILLHLAEEPYLAEMARQELCAARSFGQHPGEGAPFSLAVIKEALRLHPPTWVIARRTLREVSLSGYRIPAGQQLLFSPYLIHRDERSWVAPERFDPQRWLRNMPHPRYSYLPFSMGSRGCPGVHMGMMQSLLFVSEILRNYTLRMPSLHEVDERFEALLLPGGLRGAWVSL